MSCLALGAAFLWAGLSAQTLAGPAAPAALSQVRLLSDIVQPGTIRPGQIAIRRITLHVPDGVSLTFPDKLPPSEATEPSRSVRIHRRTEVGGIRWVLSYALTAWTEGSHRTGALAIDAHGPSGGHRLELGGAGLSVSSVLPEGRLMRPAPPEDPQPVSIPPWTYLPLIPVVLSAVTGAAWWKRAGAARAAPAQARTAPVPEPALRDVLSADHPDGSAAAIAVAHAARRHPALQAVGVRRWHTTPEILAAAAHVGGPAREALEPVLVRGDASAYGGRPAEISDVLEAGVLLLEVLEDG